MSSSSFKTKLPNNLDKIVLQDELLKTLKNSKQTSKLVNVRAKQIIMEVLKGPIEAQLLQKLQQLQQKFKTIESINFILKSENQKILQNQENKIQKVTQQMQGQLQEYEANFREEIEEKQQQIIDLSNSVNTLQAENKTMKEKIQKSQASLSNSQKTYQQLYQQNQYSKQALAKQQQRCKYLQQQLQKTKQFHQDTATKLKQNLQKQTQKHDQSYKINHNLLQQIDTINKHLQKAQKQNKYLHMEIQALTKDLKEGQKSYQILKKQIQNFKQKYQNFQAQYSQYKANSTQKLNEAQKLLHQKNKIISKLEGVQKSLKAQMLLKSKQANHSANKLYKLKIQVHQYSTEQKSLKKQIKQQFNSVSQIFKDTIQKIVNRFSDYFSAEIRNCCFDIQRLRNQVSLAQHQAKLKGDIIDHLDKILNTESKSVYELRSELKAKKRDEQRLKKRLKAQYQDTEKKLEYFKKQISIVKDDYYF